MKMPDTMALNNQQPNQPPNNMPPSPNNMQNPKSPMTPNDPDKKMGNGFPSITKFILLAVILLLLAIIINSFRSALSTSSAPEISYSEFMKQVDAKNVKEVDFKGQDAQGTLLNSATIPNSKQTYTDFTTRIPAPNGFGDPNLISDLQKANIIVKDLPQDDNSLWFSLIDYILPVLLIIGAFYFLTRKAAQGQQSIFNFGRSRAKLILQDKPSTTFADVAGVDEAKYELEEVVEFLKTPEKFQRLGGKIPRGVLLVGPPGTGKTLLARAVAGEANVPFFSMSGSEFVEVLVGIGASRVRDLFEQAKKASPSIIFIDEIDAVGRQRGTSISTNDEREQTLNQLLVEMDGFDSRQAVVVIAATNRPDGLDQALLRPGRFDRRVTVDRPDWKGRKAILEIHSKNVPLDPSVDMTLISRSTPGMVGADLANLVNEAALLAARRNMEAVNQKCFEDALDKIMLGAERPLVLSEEDLQIVAYHEGGHALVGLLTEHSDPVNKVTIVPRGQALGVTMFVPLDDKHNYSKEFLVAKIHTALGGRAAEEIMIGSITTGAESDLQSVTNIARNMVARFGMSEVLGNVSFSERQSPFFNGDFGSRDYSEETSSIIDHEVKRIVDTSYEEVKQKLSSHRATLERIAQELRKNETLNGEQLQQILKETDATLANAVLPATDSTNAGKADTPEA